ncbi:MAG: ATP-binding protein [Aquisalimonadaceae bacterium]
MNKAIIAANVVVALILAGVIGLQAGADRDDVVQHARNDVQNLRDALAEHTRQTMSVLNLSLITVAEDVMPIGTGPDADLGGVHELLARRQEASAATFAFFVLNAHGELVATSRMPDPQPADLSSYPEFRLHRQSADQDLVLGPPRLGRVGHAEGRWIANVSRRIESPDGEFAGIVGAAISIDYLLDFYDTLRIGEQGVVGLFSRDGLLIARSPFVPEYIGRDYTHTPLFRTRIKEGPSGEYTVRYPTDDLARITAYKVVEDTPAVVFVGLGEKEILAAWHNRLAFQVLIGALAMVLFISASIIVDASFKRERQWQETRSARLRRRAEETAALVRCHDINSLLSRVADVARRLIGAHQAEISLIRGGDSGQTLHATSLSDKYVQWQGRYHLSGGSDPYRLAREINHPVYMTQSQLETHPAWKKLADASNAGPPMRGWLAVPVLGQDGSKIGLIQLSDKQEGDFNENDASEALQLASVTGAVIENLLSSEARETALAQANAARAEIETIFTSISDAVIALDPDWRFIFVNTEAERVLSRSKADLLGKNMWEEFPEGRETIAFKEYNRARRDNVPVTFTLFFPPLKAWLSVRAFPHTSGLTVYFQDITQRIDTEERLRQAQKLDAIGQLTGGVAHDFNNLLTVILGNADTALESLPDAPAEVRTLISTIQQAGERGAELTHRLLAFARRQPLDPRTIDINALIAELENMLRRTLGEDVNIELVRATGLWKAVADPGELQNAILNLTLNARDAMPAGGKLTIETANMTVDSDYAEERQIKPGQYVMIAVSDTGNGMSADVRDKAFEPFFTTKTVGKGSGLGLSMVYGFARQTGGQVNIYSEPGEGTTVRLYIPRADRQDSLERRAAPASPVQRGSEHVLVVEDDELVRQHTVNSLRILGYQVTECADGDEALERLNSNTGFDLLLTDVVLPGGLSGRQVAERAAEIEPTLRVLYMSGYTENAIVHHGRLDRGVKLLGKPFRLNELARKVREGLDSEESG